MITRLYASSSADFIVHHGKEGAKRYLTMAQLGMKYQKELAAALLPFPKTQFREMGALYIAVDEGSVPELETEFSLLQELGCTDIEFWSKEKLMSTPGCPPIAVAGIFLPSDAIIDSVQYAKCLLAAAVATGNVQSFLNCEVTAVWTHNSNNCAITELASGARIVSKHVVVSTGGLFAEPALAGILSPAWSYLVGVLHPQLAESATTTSDKSVSSLVLPSPPPSANEALFSDGIPFYSCNFYTWGFTHDFCWTEGAVRVSGEDHFSAYKPPRYMERCKSLTEWVGRSYPNVYDSAEFKDLRTGPFQYGVYSETPDSCPIVGHANPSSRVCYLLGCNAWGQAAMSYGASLIPGLLGYTDLDDQQRDAMRLLTVRRFALLPSVLK
jgi:glycine/D-amino acid oxidase-like deaminating enzyme